MTVRAVSLAFLALATAVARVATAEDGLPGVLFIFKDDIELPTNTLIPFNGANGVPYSLSDVTKYRFRVVSGGQSIPLSVEDSYDDLEGHGTPFPEDGGGYGENLILLRPVTPLKPQTSYRLVIGDAQAGQEEWAARTFITGTGPDAAAPRWSQAPFMGPAQSEEPTSNEIVTAIEDVGAMPFFVIVELHPLASGARTKRMIASFPAADETGKREPCAFVSVYDHEHNVYTMDTDGDLGQLYRAELTAMDVAGNRKPAPGSIRLVWNESISVCNEPSRKKNAKAVAAPVWLGPPLVDLAANEGMIGWRAYAGDAFERRITLPVKTQAPLFIELSFSYVEDGKNASRRYLGKVSPNVGDDWRTNAAEIASPFGGPVDRCGMLSIINGEHESPVPGPNTATRLTVTLIDALGRRQSRPATQVSFAMMPSPNPPKLEEYPTVVACLEPRAIAPERRRAVENDQVPPRWNAAPKLVPKAIRTGIGYSDTDCDLLVADVTEPGPVRVSARALGGKLDRDLTQLIDARAGAAPDPRVGCAVLEPDNSDFWQSTKTAGPIELELSASDAAGNTTPAPERVTWQPSGDPIVVCTPHGAEIWRAVNLKPAPHTPHAATQPRPPSASESGRHQRVAPGSRASCACRTSNLAPRQNGLLLAMPLLLLGRRQRKKPNT